MIDLVLVAQLFVLCLCSFNVGRLFQHILKMPAITGYIITGILCGPSAFALMGKDASRLDDLKRVEQACLSIIGFAAGCELVMKELRSQAKAILFVVGAILPCVAFMLQLVTRTWLSGLQAFHDFSAPQQTAASLLICTILLARSPASAIAIVKETKAEGAFTKLCVCASIALDTIVVSTFAINTNIAHMIVDGTPLSPEAVAKPFVKIAASALCGYLLSHFIQATVLRPLRLDSHNRFAFRGLCCFGIGAAVFFVSDTLRSRDTFMRIDPLLTCVACGVCFANALVPSDDFGSIVDETLPWTNIPFFTLVGCGVSFQILPTVFHFVMALVGCRLVGLFVGAWLGGHLASLNAEQHPFRWMGFVTQAGVAIGLCKQTALEFPTWGKAVNALCVCCILVNLLFGPIAFRWVLQKVGEANADANFLQTGPGVPQWNTPVFTPKHPTAEIKVVELREAVSHAS